MKLTRHMHLVAASAVLAALFIFASQAFGLEPKPKADAAELARLYGPLPPETVDAIFTEHGFTRQQRALFVVVLRVPMEFGGSNARENLMILARSEVGPRQLLINELAEQCAQDKCTFEQAAKIIATWQN